jgi:type I restriction enzyme S subunit
MADKGEWKTVGEYVTLQRGNTYSGKLVGQLGPALLGLGSIEPGGGFRHGHYNTFGGDCPPKIMVDPGELYVALKGATKDGSMVGSIARLPRSIPSGRLTQDTARLNFSDGDPETVNHLYWILRTPQYRQYCSGRLTGSAAASFSRQDFLSYPVPPITETSKTLVNLFEAIEAKIDLNRQMNETLEAIARAIFKSWFVDFDPVRAKVARRWHRGEPLPGLPTDLYDLFPDSFENSPLGKIPCGWNVEPIGKHITAVKGLSYKGDGLADAGVPLYNLNSIYEGGGFKYEGIKYYVGDYKDRHLCMPGDVIVANTPTTTIGSR